jgi:hypothetical protein
LENFIGKKKTVWKLFAMPHEFFAKSVNFAGMDCTVHCKIAVTI